MTTYAGTATARAITVAGLGEYPYRDSNSGDRVRTSGSTTVSFRSPARALATDPAFRQARDDAYWQVIRALRRGVSKTLRAQADRIAAYFAV